MYKNAIYEIEHHECVAQDTYHMRLSGDTQYLTRPGQFVNIRLAGLYLRRPISVCDWDEGGLTLVYKVVGRGTAQLADMVCGQTLDLLTGLGNGFDMDAARGRRIALVGGGVGVPPLYGLAKRLRARGERVTSVLGFQTAHSVFFESAFAREGDCIVTTDDGSYGGRGFVTDVLRGLDYDYYFACGPEGMLRAVHALGREGQLSFEERMGCGFGACMGCSCQTVAGARRICVDGPVMHSGEVFA